MNFLRVKIISSDPKIKVLNPLINLDKIDFIDEVEGGALVAFGTILFKVDKKSLEEIQDCIHNCGGFILPRELSEELPYDEDEEDEESDRTQTGEDMND